MKAISIVALLLAVATVGGQARSSVPQLIELLVQTFKDGQLSINYHNCRSWHLAVETRNIQSFRTVPANCKDWVKDYWNSAQFQADSKTACKEAYFFAKGLDLKNDTKNAFIFDVDDTLLSTLPYYSEHGYGTEVSNSRLFYQWAKQGNAPVLPESLLLYNNLVYVVGLKPILISERDDSLQDITIQNLQNAGFPDWEKVYFKPPLWSGTNGEFKERVRKVLEKRGYTVIGSVGDQWSDLTGVNVGKRTFKLPNAVYHSD